MAILVENNPEARVHENVYGRDGDDGGDDDGDDDDRGCPPRRPRRDRGHDHDHIRPHQSPRRPRHPRRPRDAGDADDDTDDDAANDRPAHRPLVPIRHPRPDLLPPLPLRRLPHLPRPHRQEDARPRASP